MAQGKVEICGVNTAKLPILNEEEKEALFVRIKEGDREAKEEYIKGNLRLVLSVIRRFGASGENPDDLFQIGCIGLIKAVNNFNTELPCRRRELQSQSPCDNRFLPHWRNPRQNAYRLRSNESLYDLRRQAHI